MSKLDHLIVLMNSMDRAEKRYFDLHSQPYEGDKDYRLLYRIVQKMNYDADSVKAEFSRLKPKSSFEITCNHLYQNLLEKLSAKDSESELEFQILKAYQQARFLYKRNLCNESLQLIRKFKKTALEYEFFSYFLLFAKLEIRIYNQLEFDSIDEDELVRKQSKIESVSRQQRAIENLTGLYNLISLRQIKQGPVRNEAEKTKLNDLAFNELQAISGQNKDSFEAQKLHLLFQSAYFMKTANPKSSLKVYYELNQLFENNRKLWGNPPFFYINHIRGILNNLRWFGNYAEMPYFIDKLKNLLSEFPAAQATILPLIFIFENRMLTDQKLFTEALAHLHAIQDKLTEIDTNLTFATKAEIALQTAVVLIWTQNYKQALKAVRPILNAGKPFSQLPQTKPVRFINILIHCELKDFDYLESEIRSIERELKKRGKPLKSEEIILKSVLIALKETDTKRRTKKLLVQKETLQYLKNNPFERQLLNAFDFIEWIEGKLH
ncbi:MAG: hypothetical protein A2066_16485 [Bacteroidetes bacterium GWB2_41_8]|nr:MAG: hypothetical protein A2066_16485 [Bacteroidetes bacterium GWB2_41_8]